MTAPEMKRDKMKTITIAFDVDGTLRNNVSEQVVCNERIRTLLITLASFKNTKIIIWSWGGEMYARMCAKEMHISQYVDWYASKTDWLIPDIAIDDIQECAMGSINLIVKEK